MYFVFFVAFRSQNMKVKRNGSWLNITLNFWLTLLASRRKSHSHLSHLLEGQLSTMKAAGVRMVQIIQAWKHPTTLTQIWSWELLGRKKLISLGEDKSWSRLTNRRSYLKLLLPKREVVSSHEVIHISQFEIWVMEI